MTLKSDIKTGIIYTFIFRYANLLVQLITAAILARILTPNEYGIVAVVMVIVIFFQLISNFGLGTAIIQHKDLSAKNIYSLFIFCLLFGTVISIIFALSGPLISNFYNNDVYIQITLLLSVSLFFHTANIVPYAILMRDKRFKEVGIIYLVVELFTGIISIILAKNGFSYYSLVYRSILVAFLLFIIDFLLVKISFFKSFNFGVLKKLFSYSFFQLLFNVLDYSSKSSDTLFIGKYLGTIPLGLYDRAYRLVIMPVHNLSNIITPVLHPVLSEHQKNLHLIFEILGKTTRFLALIGIPLSFYLFFTGKEIILLMYGQQWMGSIQAFQILTLSIWAQMLGASNISIFQATGKTNYLFLFGFISAALLLSAIALGILVYKSYLIVAGLLVVAHIITFLFGYYLLIIELFKENLKNFLVNLRPGIVCGGAIILVNIIYEFSITLNNLLVNFLFKSVISGLTFITCLYLMRELKPFIDLINPLKK